MDFIGFGDALYEPDQQEDGQRENNAFTAPESEAPQSKLPGFRNAESLIDVGLETQVEVITDADRHRNQRELPKKLNSKNRGEQLLQVGRELVDRFHARILQ